MKNYHATFLKRGKWWVAWCEDVPGALTQGRTLTEARSNLRDALRLMLEPVDLKGMPKASMRRETIRL
jgi:predicted RNase H-like HicB family nuclease